MGFHVDTGGNIWLGSGSEDDLLSDLIGTADEPSFYVTGSGTGKIGGISLSNSSIQSVGYSSNTGFSISSGGNAVFNNVTARGTISGSVDTTFSASGSGIIKSSNSNNRLQFGAGTGAAIDFIYNSGTVGYLQAGASYLELRGYTNSYDIRLQAGGTTAEGDIWLIGENIYLQGSANSEPVLNIPNNFNISIGNAGTGSPGQVLTRTNSGAAWQSTTGHTHSGYNFPNSGTLLSDNTHVHSTNVVLNTNSAFTGFTNHVAASVGNSGSAHGLTLADVTTLGNTNVLTNATHAHGTNNINAISSSYNNNVTAYNTAFSAAGAFNMYNTINQALSNKANNSALHNAHNYFTNADVVGSHHSHSGYVSDSTFNSHTGSASAHGQYVYYNDYLNHISNFNGHTGNNNNAHGINNKANAASVNSLSNTFYTHLDFYHGGSDERLKTNIVDTTFGLEYIKSLRPVDYNFKQSIADEFMGEEDSHYKTEFVKQKHGFIAQEVQSAALINHSSMNAFGGVHVREARDTDTIEEILNLDMNQFIGPLVKAVQELSGMIELLEARIDELEGV